MGYVVQKTTCRRFLGLSTRVLGKIYWSDQLSLAHRFTKEATAQMVADRYGAIVVHVEEAHL